MTMIKDVTGIGAAKYISGQIELGWKHLSILLRNIDLDNGKIFAYVNDTISDSALHNFDRGDPDLFEKQIAEADSDLIPIENDSNDLLVDLIYEYVNFSVFNCCILEEPVGRPSDPYILKSSIKFVNIEDEMFYFLNKMSSENEIEEVYLRSEGFYFLCVLTTLDLQFQKEFIPYSNIANDLLKRSVENVTSFFVQAYDGEGYLRWVKNSG